MQASWLSDQKPTGSFTNIILINVKFSLLTLSFQQLYEAIIAIICLSEMRFNKTKVIVLSSMSFKFLECSWMYGLIILSLFLPAVLSSLLGTMRKVIKCSAHELCRNGYVSAWPWSCNSVLLELWWRFASFSTRIMTIRSLTAHSPRFWWLILEPRKTHVCQRKFLNTSPPQECWPIPVTTSKLMLGALGYRVSKEDTFVNKLTVLDLQKPCEKLERT